MTKTATTDKKEIKDVESEVKIYMTKDYSRFKILKGNRKINQKKIDKIKELITLEGIDILRYAPCIVDEEYQIMDGQHRFMVSKELGRDVYYVKIDEFGLEGVARINSNSSNWTTKDYLKSYCDLGKKPYQTVRGFVHQYNINPIVVSCLLMNKNLKNRADVNEDFKDGLLTQPHYDFTAQFLSRIGRYKQWIPGVFKRAAIEAFLRLEESETFDHDFMKERFHTSGLTIDEFTTVKEFIQHMEHVANYRMKKRIILIE